MSDAVERAVQTAFPARDVEAIERQNSRPGNETAFVAFAGGDSVYVKTATDTATRLVRETAATRYAHAHCPVGTPTVRAADPTGDVPYLVTKPLSGTPLNDPWTGDGDRERLLRRAGDAIAGIHEARFDRGGVITGGDADDLVLTDTSWAETLCETVEWRASDWFPNRFEDVPERLVETIRRIDPAFDGTTPALLHADCSRINIHLDPNGLLDWERALVGDPAFDLVDATGHLVDQADVDEEERPALRSALYDGYRDRAGDLPAGFDERRPLYRAISFLLVPQAFDDWSSGVETPADELAVEVREEFDARLERARESMA